MKIHYLKTWPKYYQLTWAGEKSAEIRFNDRGFLPGDHLVLKEWDPEVREYTGREMEVSILRVVEFPEGLREGYVLICHSLPCNIEFPEGGFGA